MIIIIHIFFNDFIFIKINCLPKSDVSTISILHNLSNLKNTLYLINLCTFTNIYKTIVEEERRSV